VTGAGFTQDFGGYLAAEMWAVIFRQPEIRRYPNLRKRMLEGLDYEALSHDVQIAHARNLTANIEMTKKEQIEFLVGAVGTVTTAAK
jgi:hypothetical protein